MSNRRFIIFFLVGIVVLGVALWMLAWRARAVATSDTRVVLCTFDARLVEEIVLREHGSNEVMLVKRKNGDWCFTRPFVETADPAPVARLLDFLTLQPIEDMRSEQELSALGAVAADFGLAHPRLDVTLRSGTQTSFFQFGSLTASGAEVYARTDGLRNVFTLSAEAYESLPRNVDAFRVRTVLSCPPEDISELDLRVPGKPAVRVARKNSAWRLEAPFVGLADETAVSALLGHLFAARIQAFGPPFRPDQIGSGAGNVFLTSYGRTPEAGLSVTVRSESGETEQIVFGDAIGTNLVWALAHNGTVIVQLDGSLVEQCRAGGASFRDTRVFPLMDGESVKSLSLTMGSSVYVLARDGKDDWHLEAPVVAPADPVPVAALVDRVLRIRQDDLQANLQASQSNIVLVSVSTSVTNHPGVAVPLSALAACGAFADLRAKTLMTVDSETVRRLSVRLAEGGETSVRWDGERRTWNLERTANNEIGGRRIRLEAVKALLAALARVEATSVETVAATTDDLRRCGLDRPTAIIAVDVESGEMSRRNVLVGGAAPSGGYYATVGGADAVFIVPKRTAADLSTPLAE